MDNERINIMKNRKGFIAALDQSGGSTTKVLLNYGIKEEDIINEETMFDLVHQMRSRIISNKEFNSNKIIGAILFEKTMNSKIDNMYTSDYLLNKNILSFLKIDVGLEEEKDGVKLLKEIPNLEDKLKHAKDMNIFGTKMRSVIYEYNEQSIKNVIKQQFSLAKTVCKNNLVPIIEPEVDINSKDKEKIEDYLKSLILEELNNWNPNDKIIFKLTIPNKDNLYLDFYNYESVLRVVALSGGYELDEACNKLSKNDKVIASFSRALLQNLNINQSEEEYTKILKETIDKIYNSSI